MSYYLNVIEYGLWSCGLCGGTLKSWHILRNIRKICVVWSGYSDDHSCIYFYNLHFPTCSFQLRPWAAQSSAVAFSEQNKKQFCNLQNIKMVARIPPKVKQISRKFWNWTTDVLNIVINFWNIQMVAYGPNHMEF